MGSTHHDHRLQSWDTKADGSGVSQGSKGIWEKEDGRGSMKSVKCGESKGSDCPINLDWSDPSTQGH